jgi:hypothetical protein
LEETMIANFQKIGEYLRPGEDPEYQSFIGRNKTKKLPLVYLFVVDGEIKYIGETRQGYSRPLSYHKNKVMKRQNEAIRRSTAAGQKVEVYALEVPSEIAVVNGLEIENHLAQDYEKALIRLHSPDWNGRP